MAPAVILVMGITGSGKTTVGRALANRLGYAFVEADDYHSPSNVARMSAGVPLDDAARGPWLRDVRRAVTERVGGGGRVVLACSALRETYRDVLLDGLPDHAIVYLEVDRETAERRLRGRVGHFMPPSLVESQIESLDEPLGAILVVPSTPLPRLVDDVIEALERDDRRGRRESTSST
jgi:gluconokinase